MVPHLIEKWTDNCEKMNAYFLVIAPPPVFLLSGDMCAKFISSAQYILQARYLRAFLFKDIMPFILHRILVPFKKKNGAQGYKIAA